MQTGIGAFGTEFGIHSALLRSMRQPNYLVLLLLALCCYCMAPEKPSFNNETKSKNATSRYLRWVGDATYDENLDDRTFQLCDNEYQVKQYFNMGNGLLYEGGKKSLKALVFAKYQTVAVAESGWIRIRFIVNCQGKTGRFRLIASDEDYQPMTYDARITNQLMTLTRNLNGWLSHYDKGDSQDYYQYLIFKIEEGRLIKLLP